MKQIAYYVYDITEFPLLLLSCEKYIEKRKEDGDNLTFFYERELTDAKSEMNGNIAHDITILSNTQLFEDCVGKIVENDGNKLKVESIVA